MKTGITSAVGLSLIVKKRKEHDNKSHFNFFHHVIKRKAFYKTGGNIRVLCMLRVNKKVSIGHNDIIVFTAQA